MFFYFFPLYMNVKATTPTTPQEANIAVALMKYGVSQCRNGAICYTVTTPLLHPKHPPY